MKRSKAPLLIGLVILAVFTAMAVAPSAFSHYGRKETFELWLSPSAQHLLGTNALGYDVFTEVVYGTRETLVIGLASSLLTLVIGAAIGVICTTRSIVGSCFNGLINIFALLPRFIALLVLASFLGRSKVIIVILIAAFSWVGVARAVRAKVIHIKTQPFIENCVVQGYSSRHIVLWHIIPNLQDVILSRFLLGVNSCIMMESSLSFLGFGDTYYPTWGTIVNLASNNGAFVREAYSYLLVPGFCITLLSLSFYFISLYVEREKETIQEA